jgi:hypothetical protein
MKVPVTRATASADRRHRGAAEEADARGDAMAFAAADDPFARRGGPETVDPHFEPSLRAEAGNAAAAATVIER